MIPPEHLSTPGERMVALEIGYKQLERRVGSLEGKMNWLLTTTILSLVGIIGTLVEVILHHS